MTKTNRFPDFFTQIHEDILFQTVECYTYAALLVFFYKLIDYILRYLHFIKILIVIHQKLSIKIKAENVYMHNKLLTSFHLCQYPKKLSFKK